jgi:hypothetical protein
MAEDEPVAKKLPGRPTKVLDCEKLLRDALEGGSLSAVPFEQGPLGPVLTYLMNLRYVQHLTPRSIAERITKKGKLHGDIHKWTAYVEDRLGLAAPLVGWLW